MVSVDNPVVLLVLGGWLFDYRCNGTEDSMKSKSCVNQVDKLVRHGHIVYSSINGCGISGGRSSNDTSPNHFTS